MPDLSQIIKAYDVRGVYPDQLDAELAERVGALEERLAKLERKLERAGGGARAKPGRRKP